VIEQDVLAAVVMATEAVAPRRTVPGCFVIVTVALLGVGATVAAGVAKVAGLMSELRRLLSTRLSATAKRRTRNMEGVRVNECVRPMPDIPLPQMLGQSLGRWR
jgi:hypothetical protein